jgi:hypothetical protein
MTDTSPDPYRADSELQKRAFRDNGCASQASSEAIAALPSDRAGAFAATTAIISGNLSAVFLWRAASRSFDCCWAK